MVKITHATSTTPRHVATFVRERPNAWLLQRAIK
jgi:hypothetical protein